MRFVDDPDPRRTRQVIEAIKERTGYVHARRRGSRKCRCGRCFVADHEFRGHLHDLALGHWVLP